ncbi:hypothetical protein [Streptomyces sp. SD15]
MKRNINLLKGAAEVIACLVLAGLCIALAVSGEAIAWLFGFGSLTYAWDVWRRSSRARTGTDPMGRHER